MSLYYKSLNVQSKCNEAIMISTVDRMFLLQGSFLCHFPASAGNVLTFCYVTPDFFSWMVLEKFRNSISLLCTLQETFFVYFRRHVVCLRDLVFDICSEIIITFLF